MENSTSSPLTISLPPHVQEFVHAQVAAGGYRSASDYIEHLVETDQRGKAQQELEQYLLEGLDSGGAVNMDRAAWEQLRRDVHDRLKLRRA
jgi:antitoxin ParD1/3/4